jgi:hypothetical protein
MHGRVTILRWLLLVGGKRRRPDRDLAAVFEVDERIEHGRVAILEPFGIGARIAFVAATIKRATT